MQINFRCFLGGFAAGAVCMGGACWYWYHRQSTLAHPLAGPTKTVIVTKPIKVYVGQKATRYVPKAVKRNVQAHVVAGTTVHHRQVTAVLDTGTGLTSLYVQPRSFFSSSRRTTIAVYEGLLGLPGGLPRVDTRIEATERLFRIGPVHIDGQASYDTAGGYFAGVGLDYRF